MYSEKNTFNDIMNRALGRVRDDIDKREGSVIYDALSPVAVELAQIYIILDDLIDLVYPDTAVDEYLDRLVEQMGIKRNEATKAIRKGMFFDEEQNKFDVDIGTRFSVDDLEYVVLSRISKGEFELQCTSPGKIGNIPVGILVPVEYNIKNLGLAQITDILVPGEDKETDEVLRRRYYEYVNEIGFSGNCADYRKKVKEIEGVGAVKVIPVWNGGGTVKLIILDSEYNKASNVLVEKVQNEICPNLSEDGLGIAPIGHNVTVVTTDEVSINVKVQVVLASTYTLTQVENSIINEINSYLKELRKNWETLETIIIRRTQIESRILNIEGILDVTETVINGKNNNVEINNDSIPILGGVSIL